MNSKKKKRKKENVNSLLHDQISVIIFGTHAILTSLRCLPAGLKTASLSLLTRVIETFPSLSRLTRLDPELCLH